jgi:phosphoenolpyruvate carboxykinase (diphosphate)
MKADIRTIPTDHLISYINIKLALLGCETVAQAPAADFHQILSSFVGQYREKERLLANHLCPADQRIQTFLYDYLQELPVAKLPLRTFVLDHPGMARVLSLPVDRDEFTSEIVSSYRVHQGVLHNPRSDRRTTHGIFHVAEGGLPIPDDKIGVPKAVFAKMLSLALDPPRSMMHLPFTTTQKQPAECFVSLLMRPIVCPEVPGFTSEKSMEIRFFAPGNLVSNLDFVETIFGNGGDPNLPENDAGLDVEHWTGHTGCVILAPHLVKTTKKQAGLPHWDQATERQRQDGMCWKNDSELYNDGNAFKLTCRDETGVIVTIIADNYFGYCKKEVKTQISYAANLYGHCEEEHAGGALVFPAYDLGEEFSGDLHVKPMGHSYDQMTGLFGQAIELSPEGCAVDKKYPDIIYVPGNAKFDLHKQRIVWTGPSGDQSIKLLPDNVRPPFRLQDPHGKAGGQSRLAIGRRGCRRFTLPQTVYRLRWRKIRNFQTNYRRHPHGARIYR